MSNPADPVSCDVAIAGGGLAGGLIALALAEKRPDLDVRIIDSGKHLGGNHVWSFFDSDVADEDRWLVEPLICHRWQGYDVAFPARRRALDAHYNSIESERLDAVVRAAVPHDRIITASISGLDAGTITLERGALIKARHIIDARGPGDLTTLVLGWQKFVGMEIRVPGGHGLTRPIVMDATVDQIDGYRFIYCLPFDTETIFIEDTYYSDTPTLDVPAIRERILGYARAKGWASNGGGREETGVLPVVIGGDFNAYWASTGEGNAKAGLRAGLFHATTGYSLPDAVRLATAIPHQIDRTPDQLTASVRSVARAGWRRNAYFRMLGAMLFRAAEPDQRYRIMERFYALSPRLIERFYSGQSTLADKARILMGKPPVPIMAAIRAIWGRNR